MNKNQRDKMKGDIPYYGANGAFDYVNDYIFDQDLILLAEDGGYYDEFQTRPIAYFVRGKSWVNNHAHILSNKKGYNLQWIFYCLVHKNVIPWINGTTRARLNLAEMKKIQILIPPPKDQKKISSILSNINSSILAYDYIIQKTKVLKKGLMHQLLTKGIGHTKFKNGYSCFKFLKNKVPYEWEIIQLKKLCDIVRGGSPRPAGDPKYFGGNIPWITVGEITKDDLIYLDFTKNSLTEEGRKHSRFLEKGNVVLTNSGYTLGYPKILNISGCANDGVAAFLKLDQRLAPEFLYFTLLSWTKFLRNVNQGVFQVNLNTDIIGKLYIPIPDLIEQRKISCILSNCVYKIRKLELQKLKLESIKKGLMQKLLTGEILVKS